MNQKPDLNVKQSGDVRQIVLVGMPGSGKSSVGEQLAGELNLPFIDIDSEIVYRENRDISTIFSTSGEDYFRKVETEVTVEALAKDGVISLGGGAVLSEKIRQHLVGKTVVWLQVSVVHATRRIGMTALRPLLLGDVRARLEVLLGEREPLYREVSTVEIVTDKKTVAEISAEIRQVVADDKSQQNS